MKSLIALSLPLALIACEIRDSQPEATRGAPPVSASTIPVPSDVRPTPVPPARFGSIGRVAREADVDLL